MSNTDESPIPNCSKSAIGELATLPGSPEDASAMDWRSRNLGWVPLFRGVAPSAVSRAIESSKILYLQPGEFLLKLGEVNDAIFLVLSGLLGVSIGESDAPESVIPLGPGECLGELSSIDGKPVSASVKVIQMVEVLHLTQDVFWNRLVVVPGVARNLMLILAERMRRNNQTILEGQRRQIELKYLRQELDLARQLQLGMLPAQNKLFPGHQDVEVAGLMEAASSIGGDLFDAFFVDAQRLFFCIGDVSGHGIAAAMFMARAVTLMRITAFEVSCPGALMKIINEQLCAGNDANMFVTLFCGFLEVDTGRMIYSNAGHLAPLHWCNGQVASLPIPKGAALGVIPGISYLRNEIILDGGEFVLCFTDGVTEAQTASGEEFSESRLMHLVADSAHYLLEPLLGHIRHAVAEFSGDERLEDDCTMLAIRRLQH